ncbi:MAG TPA: bestrophin family ion channel [Limnobacter sp.]|nr:bestrophin family ion channel [Limnobacter sp.]
MIVRPRPRAYQLIYIVRGSVVRRIAWKVLLIAALSTAVVLFSQAQEIRFLNAGLGTFSILGLALSVFLGFRNNACYDRWWEARKHWGDLIVHSRSFARELAALYPDVDQRKALVRRMIAYAHALAARLREHPEWESAKPWLPADEREALIKARNVPNAILCLQSDELAGLYRSQKLSDILYQNFSQKIAAIAVIQGACERIKTTPTPFAYSLLLRRTAWLFCLLLPFSLAPSLGMLAPLIVAAIAYTFFGLDYLGDELEEPFGLLDNDLPLNALVRGIEVDMLESLGEKDLPPYLQPVDYLLQ